MDSKKRIAEDLLCGAGSIAAFLFDDPKKRRQIYHLAQKGMIPVFRLGATLCARKSRLLRWIEQEESRSYEPSTGKSGETNDGEARHDR